MENLMKVCAKCEVEKGNLEFHKDKNTKDGLCYKCKLCNSEHSRKYWTENLEKSNEKKRKYRAANPEKVRESVKKWSIKNFEKVKENVKKWHKANPEKVKENHKKGITNLTDYYIKNQLKTQNYPQELINNPEFIEVKRLIIKTKRLCRTSQI